jgi:HAD superfamily hydrolase (TIGR01509 family)
MALAVIFDMDGVLIDSEPLHFEVARTLLAAHGLDYTKEINREFIGTSTGVVMRTLVERYRLACTADELADCYDREIVAVLGKPHDPADGVVWLIQELEARGARIGLASSSRASWIAATLAGIGLAGRFEAVVGGDMVPRGKPAPDVYLEAARRIGVAPGECVAIEDSGTGLEAALAAGMIAIGLETPHVDPQRLARAHRRLRSLKDFPLELVAR